MLTTSKCFTLLNNILLALSKYKTPEETDNIND